MLTWREGRRRGGGAVECDTSNLFLTRHDDVNAWAFKKKQQKKHKNIKKKKKQQATSESCYRKNTNVISTQIYITQKYV